METCAKFQSAGSFPHHVDVVNDDNACDDDDYDGDDDDDDDDVDEN